MLIEKKRCIIVYFNDNCELNFSYSYDINLRYAIKVLLVKWSKYVELFHYSVVVLSVAVVVLFVVVVYIWRTHEQCICRFNMCFNHGKYFPFCSLSLMNVRQLLTTRGHSKKAVSCQTFWPFKSGYKKKKFNKNTDLLAKF